MLPRPSVPPPRGRVVVALGRGGAPHRLLSGGDGEGAWCGAGEARPAVAATRAGLRSGEAAAELFVDAEDDLDGILAGLPRRIGREQAPGDAGAPVRSILVTVARLDTGDSVWVALGPPATAVLVRCWPGVAHGPEGTGSGEAPAPLAVAAEAVEAALARGRLARDAVAAALDPARREAIAEGRLAERQASLMEIAGDGVGASVRRSLAQLHAVHLALAALLGLLDGAPGVDATGRR